MLGRGALPTHPSDLADLPWLALRTYYRDVITLTHGSGGERIDLPIRPRMSTDSLYALRSAALIRYPSSRRTSWPRVLAQDVTTRGS